ETGPGGTGTGVQVPPLSVDRKWPLLLMTSTICGPCATTANTISASSAGVGSMKVHVAPASRLRARPQLVPTNTAAVLAGLIAICQANGSLSVPVAWQFSGLSAPMFTVRQVVPASSLMLIPELGFTL